MRVARSKKARACRRRRRRGQRKPSAIDLFAGAGGATQGFLNAGYEVVAAIENYTAAADTYQANHATTDLRRVDIREQDAQALRVELELRRGELHLLTACPPCQGFSSFGTRNKNDPRNDLVLEVWRFLSAFLPRCLLMENVPGLRADDRLDTFLRKARAIGYGVRTYVVDAADFGVPQRRRRLIVFGVIASPTR